LAAWLAGLLAGLLSAWLAAWLATGAHGGPGRSRRRGSCTSGGSGWCCCYAIFLCVKRLQISVFLLEREIMINL
jgi:hypothetical protein